MEYPIEFISPNGQGRQLIGTPAAATRMRAAGWRPASERPAETAEAAASATADQANKTRRRQGAEQQ